MTNRHAVLLGDDPCPRFGNGDRRDGAARSRSHTFDPLYGAIGPECPDMDNPAEDVDP